MNLHLKIVQHNVINCFTGANQQPLIKQSFDLWSFVVKKENKNVLHIKCRLSKCIKLNALESLLPRLKNSATEDAKRCCSCGSHAVNWPAAALSMKQMLEWQCGCCSCYFFRSTHCCPLLLLLFLYLSLLMLFLSCNTGFLTVLIPLGGWGAVWSHTLMHLLAEVWGERETTEEQLVGGEALLFCECHEGTDWGLRSERKRRWDGVSWSLGRREDCSAMLGIYAGLMGPDSAEYT